MRSEANAPPLKKYAARPSSVRATSESKEGDQVLLDVPEFAHLLLLVLPDLSKAVLPFSLIIGEFVILLLDQ